MFSQVVRDSGDNPQFITYRGEEVAVILPINAYRQMTKPKESLYEFIRNSPLYGTDFPLGEDRGGPVRFFDFFDDEDGTTEGHK